MATKKFDSLFEQLLNELTPVDAELGSFSSSLEKGIGTAPGGGYLIGKVADTLGISKEAVIGMISKQLYDKVFPNGVNPANNEEAYRAYITKALQEIVSDIEKDKGVKIPGAGKAVASYTARVISQLGDAKKEYGAKVSKEEVKSAVEDAEEGSVENGKPAEPKAPKAARYMDDAEYEILTPEEMSEANVELRDDLKTYYSRIENIADQVQKGRDIVKAIQRGGTDTGTAMKAVTSLIRNGAIKYATAETSDQDVEALERDETDPERVAQDYASKYFAGAMKDLELARPERMQD
jgi:hypothetical protein